ncbi:hypothetical protein CSAL01_03773 [Colletotrichum salicis]|uniref:Uncharacterized protein n=1 Tax=Colletotrichum salicis TaxID=1209931 RepID=A0A135UZJ5_9PEZI|nr:hypothetical protein CSAL01_03773 [Colletotrichum salicis]
MRIATPGRLAILAIFLTFQIVYLGSEASFHFFFHKKVTRQLLLRFQYLIAPVSVGIFGIISIPLIFDLKKGTEGDVFLKPTSATSGCQLPQERAKVDADIGGYGIRIAVWAQEFVIFFIALMGTFHSKVAGATEIGAGLIITHFSLAIALLVQLIQVKNKLSVLTPASAILGAMILDSQNMALSILLINKQTLASRWQVGIVIFCQAMTMVLIPILVRGFLGKLSNTHLSSDAGGCKFIQVFWWGKLRNFPYDQNPSIKFKRVEPSVFWVYFTFRCIVYIQSSFHALMNTHIFHEAKKDRTKTLKGITHPSLGEDNSVSGRSWERKLRDWLKAHSQDMKYDQYPTTVSLMYIVYGLFMVAAMAAAEIAIDDEKGVFELEDGRALSTGQIVAIVVAAVTIARVLWLYIPLFMNIARGADSFRWPIRLRFRA